MASDNQETDIDEIEPEAVEPSEYSRNEVAKLLGVTPRTVVRWTLEGILKRNGRNRYDADQVRRLKSRQKDGFPPADVPELDEVNLYEELTKGVGLANSHVERLFGMLEKPLTVTINGLMTMNDQMGKRLKEHDESYLTMMKAYGEILMQKDEREAMASREAVKTAMLANAAENVIPLVPTFLAQVMGKGGREKLATAKFLSSLTPEQRSQFAMMGGAFEGEQKVAFDEMMRELGMVK